MLASLTNNLHESNNQSYRVLQSKPTSMTCNCHEYCLRCSRAVQVLLVSHTSVSQMYQRCRAQPLGLIGGAWSGAFVFCVEKGRLFERSEFLPFSRRKHRSSRKNAALILSFWFFFFLERKRTGKPRPQRKRGRKRKSFYDRSGLSFGYFSF